jgi:hypothetical protein
VQCKVWREKRRLQERTCGIKVKLKRENLKMNDTKKLDRKTIMLERSFRFRCGSPNLKKGLGFLLTFVITNFEVKKLCKYTGKTPIN